MSLPADWTAADVERLLARNDPADLLHVAIAVSLDPPDCAWAQEVCIRLAAHGDANVRGNAILGFGHLARVCGALDTTRVRPLMDAALDDESAYVRGQAYAAVGDLAHFLNWDGLPD
jgi:HEAT repeat protein